MKTKNLSGLFIGTVVLIFMSVNSCKKGENTDPCETVICFNNGKCEKGICNCMDGYSGLDCSEEIKPVKVLIHKFEILRFPEFKENGDPWDYTDGPDILTQIAILDPFSVIANNQLWWEEFNNAKNGIVYEYIYQSPMEIVNVESLHGFSIHDKDGDLVGTEFMGKIDFYPYKKGQGFPDVIDLEQDEMAFKIYVGYVW